jgi:hypothetical protein
MSLDLQLADADTTQAVRGVALETPLGAHLVTQRAGYSHHGIYVGNGKVIHYSGLCTSLHRGPVEEVTLERFAAGHQVFVEHDQQARYAGTAAVERARSRLGENDYRLLTNNCEHFCTWCVCGKGRSAQVRACVTHPAVAARAVMGMCRALIAARRAARRQYVQCAACVLQAA